jgi:transposase
MLASTAQAQLDQLGPERLREFAAQLIHELQSKESLIARLTHEMALLRRIRFAARSEQFNAAQQSLFDEDTEADLQALSDQLESLSDQGKDSEESPATKPKRGPRRQVLPSDIPRREIRHEPSSTICGCGCALKRIGEDVSEKLDFVPGVFSVERHIRGK